MIGISRFHVLGILLALCFTGFLCSCGQKQRKTNKLTDLMMATVEVMADPSSTWQQIEEITDSLAISLCEATDNEKDFAQRLVAQQISLMMIGQITDKADEFRASGKELSELGFFLIVKKLMYPACRWYYSDDERLPNIWKDLYYRSNKDAVEPVDSYFHLLVTLPTTDNPSPSFHIFFPDSAEDNPRLVFMKRGEEKGPVDESDIRDQLVLTDYTKKDEVEVGYPMHSVADESFVKRLLENDILYILFQSSEAPSGEAGENEIARVELGEFQSLWQKHIKK